MSSDCPNCGANVRHVDLGRSARCPYCGTFVAAPPAAVSRRELETEREQILARENEWDARIREAQARGVEDWAAPPIGCCGLYFGLFVVGSMILSAIGAQAAKEYGTAVAAIAVGGALVGLVSIIWRRETRRRERVVALERERMADRHLREERLREIEAALDALRGGG